jgi:heme A synthase
VGGLRALAVAAPALVLVQGTLGVLSVTSLLHLPTVTAHLGVGALLLGSMVAMWTLTPSRAPGAAPTAPSLRDSADLPDAAREGAA